MKPMRAHPRVALLMFTAAMASHRNTGLGQRRVKPLEALDM